MKSSKRSDRRGIILLVVISSLAFFSILVATYLIFSRDSRQSSFVMASRNYRAPEVPDLLDEALMTLIRGTDNEFSSFFGEDLLSDYYGRRDALDFRVLNEAVRQNAFQHVGGGYVRFPIQWSNNIRPPTLETWDDLFSGRLITFLEGPLRNKTFRVKRSRVLQPEPPATTPPFTDVLYIKIDEPTLSTAVLSDTNPAVALPLLRPFFYGNTGPPATGGYAFHMNGVPRNSPGVGLVGNNLTLTLGDIQTGSPPSANAVGFQTLPVALQPSAIRPFELIDKRQIVIDGDFDEDYDAADFNNWFLSYNNPDGSIVPSFHRPAVINYILNEADWRGISDAEDYRPLLASIARGTFRPLPIGANMLAPGSPRINPQFTGGSAKYILRTPMRWSDDVGQARLRLDQLARALVRDNDINDQWDVDNSGDGKKDSIWVDIDLPTFTSREGKILKPLIAPRIEDLSGRLNINAHDNVALNNDLAALQTELANWAGTQGGYGASPGNQRTVFRGLGFGPAEIEIPATSADPTGITAAMRAAAQIAVTQRYQSRYGAAVPGRPGPDPLDTLRSGWRPNLFTAGSGYGASLDPFGRGGVALGRDGQLVAAISGRQVAAGTNPPFDRVDEAVNDPYETDPSGMSGGDSLYSFAELEPILRSNDFDIDLLPQRLRNQFYELIRIHPEFANVLTTHSVSDDTPISADQQHGAFYHQLARRINQLSGGMLTGMTLPQQTRFLSQLVAPEFRLGRKLDVNRPFGNGVDDTPFIANMNNGFGVIDEPREVSPGVLLPNNPGDPLLPVSAATVPGDYAGTVVAPVETQTYGINAGSGQTVPGPYQNIPPRYNLVNASDEQIYEHTAPNRIYPFDFELNTTTGAALGRQVTARQLMARHLYVLMMILTRDYEFPSMAETFNPARTTAADFDPNFYKARRLAQWAVNVVDYRDSDSIMTRFVFDPNPFNGWTPPPEPAPLQNVVWGVESPELVFSESLAFHDIRVRNTDRANTAGGPRDGEMDTLKNPADISEDQNTDQVRKPEGSLFLELYCARSQVIGNPEQSTKPGVPRELYNIDLPSGVAELDLVRSAPHRFDPDLDGAPVWRIAISERHDALGPKEVANPDLLTEPELMRDPQLLREAFPDSFSPETAHPNELGPARPITERLEYERYIWFRSFADRNEIETLINNNAIRGNGDLLMDADAVFFAPGAAALNQRSSNNAINSMRQLQPGQFLSLAPREVTYLGSRRTNVPSPHRFEIIDNDAANPTDDLEVTQWGVVQFNQNNQRVTPELGPTNHHTASLPMIIGAFIPPGWNATSFQNGFIGLNVSEPLANAYYPPTMFQYNGTTDSAPVPQGIDYPLFDAYLDLTDTATQARDLPADVEFNFDRIPNDGNEPIPGTVPDYCTAFLQRLADPTVPYDPLFNPYRTVDWITIDLTVFSGEEDAGTVIDDLSLEYALRSRQRNGFIGTTAQNALFSNETNRPLDEPGTILSPGADDYFTLTPTSLPVFSLQNSLSFLNTQTPAPATSTVLTGRSNPDFLGYSASIGSATTAANVQGNDRNLPDVPYAVHPWLNRPFATHYELMMVPASSAGRLFEEFSINVNAGTDPDVFPRVIPDPLSFHSPFRHLLNFFHSHRNAGIGAQFAGLFDMVHTLPRFKGEVDVTRPSALNLAGTTPGGLGNDDFFRSLFRPPYNLAYDNQRIGRINVNSITEFAVWAGLMKGHMNQDEFLAPDSGTQFSFNEFIASRRGYASPSHGLTPSPVEGLGAAPPYNYDIENLNPLYPTRFLGAFRGHQSAAFFPPLRGVGPATAPDPNEVARRRGVSATPLRPFGTIEQTDPGGGAGGSIAQFVRAAAQNPVPVLTQPEVHRNRDRSAFTRYQSLMRLPNLISENSQVYLIRLTMGFFEVDVVTGDLGREYNEDIGQNRRYRALYIIDRSKEVGFIPGQNLNARDVVLFESYAQ